MKRIPLNKLLFLFNLILKVISASKLSNSTVTNRSASYGLQNKLQSGHEPLQGNKSSTFEANHSISKGYRCDQTNETKRFRRSAFSIKHNASTIHHIQSEEKPSRTDKNYPQRPLFTSMKNANLPFSPTIFKCDAEFSADCQLKTRHFRSKILDEFNKSLAQHLNETNYYNVEYEHPDDMIKYNPTCMLLDAKLRVLTKNDAPFDRNKIGKLFPNQKMFESENFSESKSCAIISSAGSLHRSGLGAFIDLHDIVMRFNHAPTKNFEFDVGNKTTIRVVNSQVVSKSEFNFIDSPIFDNISIAAWDPGKYNGTLADWLNRPDFQLFKNYKRFLKRKPNANLFLLDPRSIWNLWKILHVYAGKKIRKNPPSSGFIGLALLLPYCSYIDMIEYIPSTRLNGRCHYYDNEMNPACTFGAWHPLAAEKLMALDMNTASDFSTFQRGIIRIRQPDLSGCN